MVHHSGTDSTTITITLDGKFRVEGWGGYDGHLKMDFDQIEDALDYVATLWGLNSGRFESNKMIVEFPKRRHIRRMIRKWLGG